MNGHSVIRPLFNVFSTGLKAREIEDQLFWSSDLIVAPTIVVREVYFPEACYLLYNVKLKLN